MKISIIVLIILRILLTMHPEEKGTWDDHRNSDDACETSSMESSSSDIDLLGPDLWGDDYAAPLEPNRQ